MFESFFFSWMKNKNNNISKVYQTLDGNVLKQWKVFSMFHGRMRSSETLKWCKQKEREDDVKFYFTFRKAIISVKFFFIDCDDRLEMISNLNDWIASKFRNYNIYTHLWCMQNFKKINHVHIAN